MPMGHGTVLQVICQGERESRQVNQADLLSDVRIRIQATSYSDKKKMSFFGIVDFQFKDVFEEPGTIAQ